MSCLDQPSPSHWGSVLSSLFLTRCGLPHGPFPVILVLKLRGLSFINGFHGEGEQDAFRFL